MILKWGKKLFCKHDWNRVDTSLQCLQSHRDNFRNEYGASMLRIKHCIKCDRLETVFFYIKGASYKSAMTAIGKAITKVLVILWIIACFLVITGLFFGIVLSMLFNYV